MKKKPANYVRTCHVRQINEATYRPPIRPTIHGTRMRGCSLEDDKDLCQQGRGLFDQQTDEASRISLVKWAHNKVRSLSSNLVSVDPLGTVKRYSKDDKKKIPVATSQTVVEYSIHMGAVDLADMLV